MGGAKGAALVMMVEIKALQDIPLGHKIALQDHANGGGGVKYGEFKTVEMASWKAYEFMQWARELRREEVDLNEIWVSTKCGESDTTSGLAPNPTVGNVFDKLVEAGATCSFGETSEITGGEHRCKERSATPSNRLSNCRPIP
ncbi:MAG: UxaA family hydrolase [Desulfobacterales bacterium]